jgi:predicted nucleotidyltransferase
MMQLAEIQQKVVPIFRHHGIKRAAVFGSVSRGQAGPASDIDILVEFGKPMGMIAYSRLVREMEESLGRKVDLVTNKSVNKFIKPYILPELKTIYEG